MKAVSFTLLCITTLWGHYVLHKILKRREEEGMAEVYATLIVKGATNPKTGNPYTFADVPAVIKPKVKAILDGLDTGELVTEE